MIYKKKELNSKIKLSNNSSFDILIFQYRNFEISKFRFFTVHRSKFGPPPVSSETE